MDWLRCQDDSGCSGSALPPWGRCLARLAPDDLDQAITQAKTEGLDARGVTVTPSLFERIFFLLDRTDKDAPIVLNARFDRATFTGDARFHKAIFIEGRATGDDSAHYRVPADLQIAGDGRYRLLGLHPSHRGELGLRPAPTVAGLPRTSLSSCPPIPTRGTATAA